MARRGAPRTTHYNYEVCMPTVDLRALNDQFAIPGRFAVKGDSDRRRLDPVQFHDGTRGQHAGFGQRHHLLPDDCVHADWQAGKVQLCFAIVQANFLKIFIDGGLAKVA